MGAERSWCPVFCLAHRILEACWYSASFGERRSSGSVLKGCRPSSSLCRVARMVVWACGRRPGLVRSSQVLHGRFPRRHYPRHPVSYSVLVKSRVVRVSWDVNVPLDPTATAAPLHTCLCLPLDNGLAMQLNKRKYIVLIQFAFFNLLCVVVKR